MAFDKKLFACVARATNSIFFYVSGDTWATIKASNYFTGKNIAGQVKAGDIIIVNSTAASGGGIGIINITAVNTTTGILTTAVGALGT